ncbi:MAG TPA: multicopper oxidase domain-containing protein, partial [Actinotalea sp.]|nr:multicopper oxidase domain-containing protein [Actinotalea sp.]
MTDPTPTTGPRPLPGHQGTGAQRGAMAVAGVVAVVALTVTAVLARPALAEPFASGPAPSAPGTSVIATGRTTAVTVTVRGMSFSPSSVEVPVGDALRVTVVNEGDQRHDLVFENGAATEPIAPGSRATVDVGVVGADLDAWCSLPGHRQMGMPLRVVAVGAPATDPTTSGGAGSGDHSGADAAASAGNHPVTTPTTAELLAAASRAAPAPAELAPLGTASEHHHTFTVTEDVEDVAAGLTRAVWTYNGGSPGPVLHGRVGDTFHITLVNDGSMGHSIDFHAGELAPDGPMRTIEPGETLEYTFTATRAGIWVYHCSTMPMSQHIANGMFGAFIIEPVDLEPVDRQYVLVQSDHDLGASGGPTDPAKVAAGIPDLVAFNGRAFQYDAHPLTARVGERVRFWVLDAGPNASWSLHVVGAQFDTVWKEGAYSLRHGISTDG